MPKSNKIIKALDKDTLREHDTLMEENKSKRSQSQLNSKATSRAALHARSRS